MLSLNKEMLNNHLIRLGGIPRNDYNQFWVSPFSISYHKSSSHSVDIIILFNCYLPVLFILGLKEQCSETIRNSIYTYTTDAISNTYNVMDEI